jgi:hypothetical protein
VQLTDLMHLVSQIWTPPAKVHGKLITMIIPSLQDTRNERMKEKVDTQCRECSRLLSTHLFVWRKPFPEKPSLKSWSKEGLCFQGMNIEDFQNYVMQHFNLVTADNRPWLLDRSIAALIWNACCAEDSPLGLASWQEEINLKRKAIR